MLDFVPFIGTDMHAIFSAVVIMVIVTTMARPPLLKWSLARRSAAA
jgi:hypothetical protein